VSSIIRFSESNLITKSDFANHCAGKRLFRVAASVLLATLSGTAGAQAFTENFDNVSLLGASGWFIQNNSSPLGANSWYQGVPTTATPDPGPFDAYNGAANAYIAANFAATTGSTGTISDWLVAPNRTFRNGDVFQFFTRKPTTPPGGTEYPDRLEVRLSTNGASTNVGSSAAAWGDFSTLMLSINPTLTTNVYPQVWTQYTITISGLPAPTSGRMAFRYFVTGAGPQGSNSDYIGIDNVVYTPYVCPALAVSPSSLFDATWGQAYSQSLSQTGALGAPSFAVTAGALPPGLTLTANGVISGTATATGTFNFTVTVNDASGCSGSTSYSITVQPAAQTLTFPAQTNPSLWFRVGDTFAIAPEASSALPNSGLPIVYSSLATGVCDVSGTTVMMVSAGTCTIAADQGGDGNFAAAPQVTTQVMLVVPTEADLWVQSTAASAVVNLGDTVSYTILVGNDGPADAVNVRVLDTPPLRLDAASVTWQCLEATGTSCPVPSSGTGALDATISSLPMNAAVRFQLLGTLISASDPADEYMEFPNIATVALPPGSSLTDPPGNNQSTANVRESDVIFADGFEAPPTL